METSRRSPGHISGPDDFRNLDEFDREARTLALSSVTRARDNGITVEDAATQLGTDIDNVRWWASEALGSSTRAGTTPTPDDDLFRVRPMALDGDVGFIGVRGSRQARAADRIFGTQWDYAQGTASVDELDRLPDQFARRWVVKDPYELDDLAREGGFDIEELYRAVFGS